MHSLKTFGFIILFLLNIVDTKGLLVHGNINSTDPIHGTLGHFVDEAEVMQILMNQTSELENIKRQAENDRSTLKLLQNQSQELTQRVENDKSTIQSLQNRIFFLEAELKERNASNPISSQESSTYLMSINKLIQNVAANEKNDKNLSQRVDALVKHFDDLNIQVRYTTLSLLDVHSLTEDLNSSLSQRLEDRITYISEHCASMDDFI